MSNIGKGVFLKVFIFGGMNYSNMPVNIRVLLLEDVCWLLDDNTLKTIFYAIIFQGYTLFLHFMHFWYFLLKEKVHEPHESAL